MGISQYTDKMLSDWESRSRKLEKFEDELKKGLPCHFSAILQPKKLLLWREMLEHCGYPDPQVVDEVLLSADLIGQVPLTGKSSPDYLKSWQPRLEPRSWLVSGLKEQLMRGSLPSRKMRLSVVGWRDRSLLSRQVKVVLLVGDLG